MTREEIFELVNNERDRQDAKWGCSPRSLHNTLWMTIMTEEVGECARATLEKDEVNLQEEIIQVISVGVAWLEDNTGVSE